MASSLRRVKSAIAPVVKRVLSDAAAYSGLYRLAARTYGGVGIILSLHRVVETGHLILYPGYMTYSDTLGLVLGEVRRLGWEIVTLDEMSRRLMAQDSGQRFVCFTCDDGYADNLQVALPVFRSHQAPFAVYLCVGVLERSLFYWWGGLEELVVHNDRIEFHVPGEPGPKALWARTVPEKAEALDTLDSYCHALGGGFARDLFTRYRVDADALLDRDALTIAQARELASDPLVTIGAHGITHERLSRLSEGDANRELHHGRRMLEDWLGREVWHLAYPFGKADACGPREFALAKAAGYRTAVTTRQGNLFAEHRDFLECLPRREIPTGRTRLRNALFGVETLLSRRAKFQTT